MDNVVSRQQIPMSEAYAMVLGPLLIQKPLMLQIYWVNLMISMSMQIELSSGNAISDREK